MGNLNITSKVVTANKSAEQLFDQLSDFKNFESVMPDSVERFEADENSFLFQLRNLPEVRLVAEEKQRPDFIKLKSASSKLDFSLNCQIEKIDDNNCKAGFVFDGEFNMMMRMMIEKPLSTFIESLADKVATL